MTVLFFIRINRNIVECKALKCLFGLDTSLVLIETLWNVKLSAILDSSSSILVLIETLWNVKEMESLINRCANIVLIETLWNVKSASVAMLW